MISVSEAHEAIRRFIPKPEKESVGLRDCAGRVLAEEIGASFPQPRFDNSAMDGFAVRWEDTAGASPNRPVKLTLKGVIPAGSAAKVTVERGECCQVMTGAPIPPGADAVVMVEHTSGFESEREVHVLKPAVKNQHIRFEGEEIAKGETVIPSGTKIGAAEIGVLATFGRATVEVYRRPRLALFATGNELREPGEFLEPGEIYNSNLYIFSNLAARVGAEVQTCETLDDNRDSVKEFLTRSLDCCDIIVSSGGVSMGRYDHVRNILLKLGVKEHFWKVAQKPGKPLFFGSAGDVLIFALPGNPVSSFICFMEYVWPTCERWMGLEPHPKVRATLAAPFPQGHDRHRFLFGKVWLENGQMRCMPGTKTGSHMLTSTVDANCILEVEMGKGNLEPGHSVELRMLPWKSV